MKERREKRERHEGRFARARERAVQKKVTNAFKRARVIFFFEEDEERERASEKKIRVWVADFKSKGQGKRNFF